jgi:hypothetical protein
MAQRNRSLPRAVDIRLAHGLLPDPVPPAVAELLSAGLVAFTHAVAIVYQPPSRAGYSRAPLTDHSIGAPRLAAG